MHLVEQLFRASYGWKPDQVPVAVDTPLGERHLVAIERAKAFMLARFEEDLSLDQIAQAACVSTFHFSRIFKRLAGHSPYQYLVEARLNHAALLLRHTTTSVTEICFASGFNGLSHFTESFSRRFHVSPSVYRAT